jgi:hypothetical protein
MKKVIRQYIPPVRYSEAEQVSAIKADLLRDAHYSEEQAANGPYYPDRGITKESLLAYAADCRTTAAKTFTSTQFIQGKIT